MRERTGLSKKSSIRLLEKVLKYGKSEDYFKGKLKIYLISNKEVYIPDAMGNKTMIRVYGEFIYIIRENKLITVLNVPNDLKKYLTKTIT